MPHPHPPPPPPLLPPQQICLLSCLTALSSAGGGGNISAAAAASAEGVDAIVQELVQHIPSQPRVTSGPFQFAIDHCFSIKGQGTVMTGTVLAGQVKVNDSIELPELKVR